MVLHARQVPRIMRTVGTVLVGTLFFMLPAFYNGYPLVFSDTAAYILGLPLAILSNIISIHRPLSYAFIFPIGLYNLLWPVVVVQSLLITWLLWVSISAILGRHSNRIFLAIALFLSLFSNIAWHTTYLMPDAFTAIMILAMSVIIFYELPTKTKWIMSIVVVWMTTTHGSHMLLMVALSGGIGSIWLISRIWRKHARIAPLYAVLRTVNWKLLAVLVALPWLLTPLLHYSVTGEGEYIKGAPIFLAARLIESGVAEDWLKEYCPTHPHPLCAYREGLTRSTDDFIWRSSSPLAALGGDGEIVDQLAELNKSILTNPRYALLFAYDSSKRFLQLLPQHELLAARSPYLDGTSTHAIIQKHYSIEWAAYTSARQYQGRLATPLEVVAIISAISSIASLLLICFFLFVHNKPFTLRVRLLVVWGLMGIMLNACISASLSGVFARYNARVVWLLPLYGALLVVLYYTHRAKKNQKRGESRGGGTPAWRGHASVEARQRVCPMARREVVAVGRRVREMARGTPQSEYFTPTSTNGIPLIYNVLWIFFGGYYR